MVIGHILIHLYLSLQEKRGVLIMNTSEGCCTYVSRAHGRSGSVRTCYIRLDTYKHIHLESRLLDSKTAALADAIHCSQAAYDIIHYMLYQPAICLARLLAETSLATALSPMCLLHFCTLPVRPYPHYTCHTPISTA
jgi:hypothetical protein